MVVRDMALSRLEQLQPRMSCELRPALAESDLAMLLDGGVPRATVTCADVMRPAEGAGL